jgi:hypothetical protein
MVERTPLESMRSKTRAIYIPTAALSCLVIH